MLSQFFVKGLIAGCSIAAPVGPTTVLVIHRTIKQRFSSGVKSGLGAATADASFGLLAAFGVGFIAQTISSHQFYIRLIGGAFLLFWGARIFMSKFAEQHPLVKGEGWKGSFLSTYILTLTNPMTLLAFMAILAGLGQVKISREWQNIFQWMAGICLGSFGWWLLLAFGVFIFRKKFSFKVLEYVNKGTGFVVVIAGVLVLLSLR